MNKKNKLNFIREQTGNVKLPKYIGCETLNSLTENKGEE